MRLFLLTRTDETDYDQYISFVVVARNEEEAKLIHPAGLIWRGEQWLERNVETGKLQPARWHTNSWVKDVKYVEAHRIGKAEKHYEPGDIIISNYRAG